MKQDPHYTPKAEATAALSKATEYFALFLLEEVKKVSDGKNRIDSKVLYDCISTIASYVDNKNSLSFLDCLIEEHNKETIDPKKK